jgi:hypothetical protein
MVSAMSELRRINTARMARTIGPRLGISLLVALGVLCGASAARANDIYIAQTAAGTASGADCADAHPVSWFNSSGNWGNSSAQIGPGTTVHLCGTFTASAGADSYLQFQGSGASGNPITLKWESGAIVQAPYFSNAHGGINGNGAAFITLDGGTNGVVQNTANGTALPYQQGSTLISGFGSHFTVQNLKVGPVYTHLLNDANGGGSWGVEIAGQSNVLIGPNNTFSQCDVCIFDDWTSANNSNLEVEFNNFTLSNQDMEFGFSPAGNFSGLLVHDNTASAWNNWDDAGNNYHHNFLHTFTNLPGASLTGTLQVWNNKLVGSLGAHATSFIFLENNNGGSGGTCTAFTIFNNVFDKTNSSVPTSSGEVATMCPTNIYNNTFMDAGGTGNNAWNAVNSYVGGMILKNNIFYNNGTFVYQESSGITASNNDYYLGSPQWVYISTFENSLASWQAGCACDASSFTANPNLNAATFVPKAGSRVVGAGANLTSVGITSLDVDAAGVVRPPSGAWDIGAYQSGSTASGPLPPTSLTAIAR